MDIQVGGSTLQSTIFESTCESDISYKIHEDNSHSIHIQQHKCHFKKQNIVHTQYHMQLLYQNSHDPIDWTTHDET